MVRLFKSYYNILFYIILDEVILYFIMVYYMKLFVVMICFLASYKFIVSHSILNHIDILHILTLRVDKQNIQIQYIYIYIHRFFRRYFW